MSKARLVVLVLAACAVVSSVAAAENRKLLQSDYLGYRSRFNVEAPQASRFSIGAATGASGPAEFRERTSLTGPSPPSAAFGVNPTGGFAEYKDTTRFDATLPRYSGVFRASQANTWAADLSAGTRLLPDFQSSTKIHPTIPLTFPVFSLGGSILPTPTYQAVINPPRGVLGAPVPAPKAKAGGKDGAPEGKDGADGKEGGGGDGKDGGRRRLLNYGAQRTFTAKAPSAPRFDTYMRPPPGVSSNTLGIRADQPNVLSDYKVPSNLVQSSGETSAVFGPQRPFPVGGKGDWTVVNLSRGPSRIASTTDMAINWGSGSTVFNNGVPLAINRAEGTLMPNPSKYTGVSWSPQLGDRPDGFIEAKTRTNVPIPGVGK